MFIEKTMSLSLSEFSNSIRAFAGETAGAAAREHGMANFTIGQVSAQIAYKALPDVRLGGLLHLPRATVTLELSGGSEPQQKEFLRNFETSFQRGGG